MVKTDLDRSAIALLVVLCTVWGFQQVTIKWALEGVPPLMQAGLRSVIAVLLLSIWMLWRGERPWQKDGSAGWGLLAGVLFAGEFQLLYWGLEYTTASRAAVFLHTSPFVVAIGVHFFVPGERLSLIKLVGLGCAFTGIALAFYNGFDTSGTQFYGDLMVLSAALFWGATTVVVKASSQRTLSAEKVLFYQLAVSALLLPLGSWLMAEPGIAQLSNRVLGSLLYQGVIVAFVSYVAWYWLIREYQASKLTAFGFLTPLFGVLAGYLFLQEAITTNFLLALLFVTFGIFLVNRPQRSSSPPRQ